MPEIFPSYVLKTLEILNAAGFEAYVAGGAVRDLLLGLEPDDYDITTGARPEQVAAVFRAAGYRLADNLGKNYGVVAAVTEGHTLEIATFRNERYVYGQDAHRPAEVWYCDTLREDLSRRDFTVNAMAMDASGKLYDFYGGKKDLEAKLLRTVGDAKKRFAEDALRMYRACRFVAQLGFTYVEGADTAEDVAGDYDYTRSAEQNLRDAMERAGKAVPDNMKAMGPDAQLTAIPGENGFGQPGTRYRLKKRYRFDVSRCRNLSLERVKKELDKMLLGKDAGKGLALFLSSGLAEAQCRIRSKGGETFAGVLPELANLPGLQQNIRFHCYNVWEHILAAVDNGPRDLTLRWALLLHDVAKGLKGIRGKTPDGYPNDHGHEKESAKMAEAVLTRLHYPAAFVKRVTWLVARHMRFAPMLIRKNNTLLRWIRSEATGGTFRTEAEMAEAFSQLTEVFLADMGATWAGVLREPVMDEGRRLGNEAVRIAREQMPVHTSDLNIRGNDIREILKEHGLQKKEGFAAEAKISAGPKEKARENPQEKPETDITETDIDIKEETAVTAGSVLRYLLVRVQSGSIPNEREALLRAAARKLEKTQK